MVGKEKYVYEIGRLVEIIIYVNPGPRNEIQLGFSEVRALNGITLIFLKMPTPFPQTVR